MFKRLAVCASEAVDELSWLILSYGHCIIRLTCVH